MGTFTEFPNLASIVKIAVEEYQAQTSIQLADHPLASKLEKCDSVMSVTRVLEGQLKAFRESCGKVIKPLKRIVHILHALSTCAVLGEVIGLPCSPAKTVLAAVCILLAAVEDVSATYDALVDLFDSLESFLNPLDIYIKSPPTPALTVMVVNIMIELLRTLALATGQVKQGRLKKSREEAWGDIDVIAALQTLNRSIQDETRSCAAEILQVVHGLVQIMRAAMGEANELTNDVKDARVMVGQIVNKMKRDHLHQDLQKWLSPPDPRKNHNIACEVHHSGTATWFIQGKAFVEWKSSGSLLWVHGKPGSGKSVLCSVIIEDINRMCKSELALLAFYYCDFRDDEKQDRRGLLSSLLLQFCAQSDAYYNILSDFYSAHRHGSHYASDGELEKCLEDMFKLPGQPPIYIIVDGLDECPKSSGMPSPREKILTLVEKLVRLALPNLRICVTSRPEADIEAALRPLTPRSVSLHEERGQRQDISAYVTAVVNSDPRMQRWRAEDKERVIGVLSRKADGMFRWASCQLDVLRHCLPAGIRRALDELPETLNETYERTLRDIDEQNWEYAHRMFQCITVASRPLRVEELAEFLAFDFDAGQIPTFLPDWRPDDPRDAVLSTCSSLIAIVEVNHSLVIQFSHFSVKEFLTSSRLATARGTIFRRYYVPIMPAHTIVARACLGILLHLDDNICGNNLKHFPLAEYAARHWADHAEFVNVSSSMQDGMKLLFDPRKPHFSVWVWIYDPDAPWIQFQRPKSPSQPRGSPLHYAALYGLRDVADFLIIEHSQDVNARSGSRNVTPLSVACDKGHLDVIHLLLEHRADPNIRDGSYEAPLHGVSQRGHVEIARVLLEYGADANVRGIGDSTPLRLALQAGHLEVLRVLLEHGADANTRDQLNRTPLHQASREGHVDVAQVFIDHGADTNSRDSSNWTPLHWASQGGHVQVARLLFEHGADANAQAFGYSTPLHWASKEGHLEMARFLLDHGADSNSRDGDNCISLHWASRRGHPEVASVLLEHGADPNSRGNKREAPLHQALQGGHLEVARVLLEHGANPNSRDNDRETPLHQALEGGHLEVARVLLEHGANPNSRGNNSETPLHQALEGGHLEVARVLLEHGADPNSPHSNKETPLHRALQGGHLEVARVLLEHGANPNSPYSNKETPLHRALQGGHLEVARVLLEHGADPNSPHSNKESPLHLARTSGHLDVTRDLLEHGADPNSRNSNNVTPLHRASQGGHPEVARVLLEHGADPNSRDSDKETPLHRASKRGHPEVARVLLEHGAAPNSLDFHKETPLHRASQRGYLDVARVLLEHGANPNSDKETPLHQASQRGFLDVARVLLEHGARPNSQNSGNETPLHQASRGHPDVARVLLEHGADPNSRDSNDVTPLHQASQGGHPDDARVLLEHCADPNSRDINKETPLHRASQQGYLDVARVLLEHGADPNSRDSNNETPLHRASQRHLNVARVLLEHGADPNSRDFNDQTPLHRASQYGYLEVSRVLLEHGANANVSPRSSSLRYTSQRHRPGVARTFFGSAHIDALHDPDSTPLHFASQCGSLEVARLLLEHGADVNARNGRNKRPLDEASDVEMRTLLASFSRTPRMRMPQKVATGLRRLWRR